MSTRSIFLILVNIWSATVVILNALHSPWIIAAAVLFVANLYWFWKSEDL